eukprot:9871857-Lingulodinium_polyedra.AAC.1
MRALLGDAGARCGHRCFLDVFAGQGEVCAAMRRHGHPALAWDIRRGRSWDLLLAANRRMIRGW